MTTQIGFIKRPYRSLNKQNKINIFSTLPDQVTKPQEKLLKNQLHSYDIVGPKQIRNQIMEQKLKYSKVSDSLDILEFKNTLQQNASQKSTINRDSVLSKFTYGDQRYLTRQLRNIQHYKDYEQIWKKDNEKVRSLSQNNKITLLQSMKKPIQIMPNPQKDKIIQNYIVTYWQKSLRNNSLQLKRYLKGNTQFTQNQLQAMLQRQQGTKQIQKLLPKLPIQRLSKMKQSLTLTGRNKLNLQTQKHPQTISIYTSRKSKISEINSNQQLFRLDYDSSHFHLKQACLC